MENGLVRAISDTDGLKDKIRTHTETMLQRRGVRDIEINKQ